METRKGWRNRDASAEEQVLALLDALRDALGASSVGLFDDDRGDPDGRAMALDFRDAFDPPPCGGIDWASWYRALKRDEQVDVTCGCGSHHRLCGFLLHRRWALLLLGPPVAEAAFPAATASTLQALRAMLPPGPAAGEAPLAEAEREQRGSVGQGPPVPLFWVRKARH